MSTMIYLDNAATTYPKPEEVYSAMDKANREIGVNAGRGSYKVAREASNLISNTKQLLREIVHAESTASVVFSPSITIAMNQIVNGIKWPEHSTVYVSPYEHNAVARTLNKISKEKGINIRLMPVDSETYEIDMEKLRYQFSKEKPYAVFCTHVSNVTGYILPIVEIFSIAKGYGSVTVLDSAQSLGLIDIDMRNSLIDILAFAGHKTLYGPFGIGGFINNANLELLPFITGGTGSDSLNLDMPNGNEGRYEAASMNIVAIAGLNAALKCIEVPKCFSHEKELTEYLLERIESNRKVHTYLPKDLNAHVGIVSFTVQDMNSEDVGTILDEDFDIAVRTGYHCAPYIHDYLNDKGKLGTIRVGLSQFTSKEDIDALITALAEIVEE